MGGKSKDPNKAAMRAQDAQMKRLKGLSVPELEEYMLQSPELVGLLDAEQLQDTKLGDIQTDSRLKENQMKALEGLSQRADEGLTVEDKYAMEQMLGDVSNQEKSQRADIEQDMMRKGQDVSGLSIMSKLQNSQSSSNNARDKAMQMALGASQSKQQALANLAQQSGQMEQADYNKQANLASARDAIMKSNAMNKQNVNATNLGARQSVANQEANIANQQAQVANQIAQQNYNNQVTKVTGQGNVANAQSNIAGNAPAKPGGLQAGLAGAASMGAATGGNPYAMAAGGAAGLLSSFEDGGIAQKEAASHDKFKKDYMKRVREELAPKKEVIHAEDSAIVPFKDAFSTARNAHGGDGGQFDWNGKQYTTDVAKTESPSIDNSQRQQPSDIFSGGFNKLLKGDATVNQTIKDLGGKKLGIDNDITSQEVQTHAEAKPVLEAGPDKGIDGDKLSKGLGALSKLIGGGEQQKRSPLNLGQFSMGQPENVMGVVGPSDFSNPYAQARFENGGITTNLNYKKHTPNYEDGGTCMAEDGSLMFTSDGNGDTIGGESFERDRVDAKLNSGEAVLNVAQQQRLMDLIKGEISPNELGSDNIVEGVPSDYQEDLLGDIEDGDENTETKGFKKLLNLLGK